MAAAVAGAVLLGACGSSGPITPPKVPGTARATTPTTVGGPMTAARYAEATASICLGGDTPAAPSGSGPQASAARIGTIARAYRARHGALGALEAPAGQEATVSAFLDASDRLADAFDAWANRADEWARAGGGGVETAGYRRMLSAYGAVQDAQSALSGPARAAGAVSCAMDAPGS